MSSTDSSSAASPTSERKKPRGRSKTKKSPSNKALLEKPSSANAKSEITMEEEVRLLLQLLVLSLLLVFPLTLLFSTTSNSVLGFVAHLYVNATSAIISLGALLLKWLLLLPVYLASFASVFFLWLFNCNQHSVLQQIVAPPADGLSTKV